MRIAVCDDERLFLDSLKKAVYDYSNRHRLELSIDNFYSGEELLGSELVYDMIILDYKMGGMDGLETARRLREKNQNCAIVFLTSYPDIVYESFEVNTFRFLTKPLDVGKLYKTFDNYFEMFGNNYPILLKVDRDTICIQTNEIMFLEADNKKCYIYLAEKRIHCAKTMATIAKLLPSGIFFKVSKQIVVNFNHIQKHDNSRIYFTNDKFVYISRMYMAPFRNAYKEYAKALAI